jgi:hypothetical protein
LAHENQRDPALERNAAREHEPARAVAGERRARLRREQSGEHEVSVARDEARHRRCERLERLEQDVGEDQLERRALAKDAGVETCDANGVDVGGRAVVAGIVACDGDRAGIDVARQHGPPQRFRRSDGEHAGAGADVEHECSFSPFAS